MVLATGPGLKNKKGDSIAVSVQTGDKVLLPQFGGTTLKVGDDVSAVSFFASSFGAQTRRSLTGISHVQGQS